MQLLSEQTTTTYIDIALSRQIMMKGFCLLSVSLRIIHKKSGGTLFLTLTTKMSLILDPFMYYKFEEKLYRK